MDLTTICEITSLLSGRDPKDTIGYLPVIKEAINEVRRMLKDRHDEPIHCDRLNMVCAAVAYYRLALIEASRGDAVAVKLGNISMDGDPKLRLEIAKELLSHYLEGASDILSNDDFVFRSVI
ncbi:MAG: hypothetical protein GX967_02285 [Clostridiales bacterium]|nr:hypothetical protein [Clostridiales bacterium]